MKRKILIVLLAALCLAGCGRAEDPYRVDTVVYIPADPTEPETQASTEVSQTETLPEATEAATEPEATEAETEPEPTEKKTTTKKTSSTKKTGSTKKTDSKKDTGSKTESSSKKNQEEQKETATKATEPPAEKPAATEPPVTEPPVTEPPITEPPATEPPETEPEPTDPPLYDISGYSVGSLEKNMKEAINAYRADEGLEELSLSSRLCAIASCRGYEISRVWSHDRPDGRSYKTVLSDYGYSAGSVKELLLHVPGSGDADAIVEKWMNSASYRELLLGNYTTVGIGVYRTDGTTYIACLLVR